MDLALLGIHRSHKQFACHVLPCVCVVILWVVRISHPGQTPVWFCDLEGDKTMISLIS